MEAKSSDVLGGEGACNAAVMDGPWPASMLLTIRQDAAIGPPHEPYGIRAAPGLSPSNEAQQLAISRA